jgi:plasmid stabilization system protein ParE
MSCITEAMEHLGTEKTAAEGKYRQLVEAVASGVRNPGRDDLATLGVLGKTLDQFEHDCQDAAAVLADRAAGREAQRLTVGPLREGQAAVARFNADLAEIDRIGQAVGAAVYNAPRQAVDQARDYARRLQDEVTILAAFPNRKKLEGHRAGLDGLNERLHAAQSGLRDCPSSRDLDGKQQDIRLLEKEIAEYGRKPIEFSSVAANLPSAPSPVDLYRVVLYAVVGELKKAVPVDQHPEVFGKLAEVFAAEAKLSS